MKILDTGDFSAVTARNKRFFEIWEEYLALPPQKVAEKLTSKKEKIRPFSFVISPLDNNGAALGGSPAGTGA